MKVTLREWKYVSIPTVGCWFKVNPLAIDRNLFNQAREDSRQEELRKIILEAFEELNKNSKYLRPFKTMIPKKTVWKEVSVLELKEIASSLGDHMANWVEQALEWAQRINNGETWENICNQPEYVLYHRMVIWKNGLSRVIGGAIENAIPPFSIGKYEYSDKDECMLFVTKVVPLVVDYDY